MQPRTAFRLILAAALAAILMLGMPGAAFGSVDQKGVTPMPTKGVPPPATAQPQQPAPTTAAVTGSIQVTSTLELDLMAGPLRTAAFLAPNGERFAHIGEEVCFYRIDGTQEACYAIPEDMRLHGESVHWSPDSTRLVFMDSDLFRYFADTDIWTLDADTGQFTNLTDDGVLGGVILRPLDANLDYSPIWSADGTQIAFLRIVQTQGETAPVTLYTMSADGSNLAARQVITENGRFRIMNIAWGPDGDTFAYFHDWREAADAMWSGVWLFKLSDPNPQRLLMVDYSSLPNEMTFSHDGASLLVTLRTAMAGADINAGPEAYPAWVVPVDGGTPIALDAARRVRAAAWQEGGSALAYVVLEPDNADESGLYLAVGPGQPGQRALPGEFIGPINQGERMAWGANGVTLLAGRGGRPLTVVSTDATPTPALVPTESAQPAQTNSPIVVESTLELDLIAGPGRSGAFLAPNGERFAHFGRDVCFYHVDGTQEACYPFPEDLQPSVDTVRWAPDSTRLLFMDSDLTRTFRDSDLWTLDANTGQFTNLTDDGYAGGVVLRPVNANLDFAPIWSPDGTQIAFLRYVQTERDIAPLGLYTISADGGDPVAQHVLAEHGHFRILSLAWAPDGDTIAYFHDWIDGEDVMWAGVWLFKLSDPNPERLMAVDYASLANELAFSHDGANLLVTLRTASGMATGTPQPEDFPAWVLPVDGSAPMAIDAAHIVRAATWLQGGSALAYTVFEPANPDANGLYAAAGPGQPGQRALSGEFVGPTSLGERMSWGANGVTLVVGRGGSPLVVVSMNVAASSAPTPTKSAPPDQTGSALVVRSTLDTGILAGRGGTAAVLAPNGERFAHFAEQVCIYGVDGTQQACYAFPGTGRPHTESARWSPDSTRLVFMDNNLFRTYADADIWTLDADSGQFSNVTDDGYDGRIIAGDADANLDYGPVWSPDGTQIAFMRVAQTGEDFGPATIMTVAAEGGEAQARHEVDEAGPFRILSIAWGSDGDTMAYVHYWRGEEDESWAGVWSFRLSDPNPQRILAIDRPLMPGPMTFSPDGHNVLITLQDGSFAAYRPEDFPAWIVPVDGSGALAVDPAHVVRAAAWREGDGGSALAYVVFEPLAMENSGLYLSAGPGQPGTLALSGEYFAPSNQGDRLDWATNGVLLLAQLDDWAVLTVNTGE